MLINEPKIEGERVLPMMAPSVEQLNEFDKKADAEIANNQVSADAALTEVKTATTTTAAKEMTGAFRSSSALTKINDTKAGMENIDKEKINAIILKHSKNSKFFKKQQEREIEIRRKTSEKYQMFENNYSQAQVAKAEILADEYLNACEKSRDMSRHIVHIDMDAFYANVEIRDNPSLGDKPMAVGSEHMLSTSNYLARRFGVRAAMPGFIARELCPQLVIVPCNFKKYRVESAKIMEIIEKYDSNYVAMSLDEAYLDLTEHLKLRAHMDAAYRTYPAKSVDEDDEDSMITFGVDVEECVRELRHRIFLATRLTASAGIACNLRLAKLCSDCNKPNGQFRLENNRDVILEFIRGLPVRKFNGIGPTTAIMLECYGISICEDLYMKRALLYLLESENTFEFLMNVCRGIGSSRIEHSNELRKSLSHETTFSPKIANNKSELLRIIQELSDEVAHQMLKENLEASKVSIKLKTTNFEILSRTKSLDAFTKSSEEIFCAASFLFENEWKLSKEKLSLRLVGVRVSDFREQDAEEEPKRSTKRPRVKNHNQERSSAKIMEKFVRKGAQQQTPISRSACHDEDKNELIDLKQFCAFTCPHCDESFEGNRDFFDQHIDACF